MFQNIMEMFRTQPAQNTPPAGTATPPPSGTPDPQKGLPNTTQTPQTGANGLVPADAPGNKKEDNPLAGLEQFKDLFAPIPDDKQPKPAPSITANLDPKKIQDAAASIDFSKVITPEIMTAAIAGGQEGIAALVKAMNLMSQQVYARSAIATGNIVEVALKQAKDQFEAQLPAMVRSHAVSDSVATTHPAMANPAVQPMVEAIKTMLIQKNPTATSAEITKNVNDYFNAIAGVFAPKTEAASGDKGDKSKGNVYDFTSFLTGTNAGAN